MIECRYQNILNSFVGHLPFLHNSKIITYILYMFETTEIEMS
jgi:hypothetical protein